jgi:hypothetical protein
LRENKGGIGPPSGGLSPVCYAHSAGWKKRLAGDLSDGFSRK